LRGKSLLPAGVIDVTGSFVVGDPIAVKDDQGNVVARGLAGMSADDLLKVKGRKLADIPGVLGGRSATEVVHRGHLVIL
jgi:glutamate 5-kinase